jgi:lysozyme family protein
VIGNTVNFDEAFDRLMGHEGGYVNHPSDPGGETNWGITKRVAMAFGWVGDMRYLTRETAKQIAYQQYWLAAQCDKLAGPLAFQMLDAAFNHGIGNATRFLQRAAGVADDGRVGPVTLAKLAQMEVNDVLLRFNAERLEFYTKLSTWPTFSKGWALRVVGNLRFAAQDN